jgi:hypothetical protein
MTSGLSRQQRRRLDRVLRKLHYTDACSICGTPFPHNSQTASGFDAQGKLVLAGECCMKRVVKIFTRGFYSTRKYDFLLPSNTKPSTELTDAQITNAIAAYQKVIAATDKRFDDIVRRSGGTHTNGITFKVNPPDGPWKEDDRNWFEQNPKRSHRARLPFPGEADKEAAGTPAEHTMIMLVRQVEPGNRLKTNFYLTTEALPVPDDEAIIHALFEIAMEREPLPLNVEAFHALIAKYQAQESGQ